MHILMMHFAILFSLPVGQSRSLIAHGVVHHTLHWYMSGRIPLAEVF